MSEIFNRKLVKGTSPHRDAIIAIFEKKGDKTRIYYGDKVGKVFIANETKLKEYRSKPQTSPYILVKFDKSRFKTLQQQYDETFKEAVYLKELTKGRINIFRTGSTAKTALQLFYDLCPVKETDPDAMCEKEQEILHKANSGALIWGVPYKGKAYKYDVVSEYPSVMISKYLKIPFGGVVFKKMTNDELQNMKYFKYGIYHVEVESSDHRLFRNNSENWYTHTDLNYALQVLKYKLRFVEDGEDNAMMYTKLRSAREVFKPFVDYLFEFKKQGVKEVKKYINALWGALSQTNTLEVKVSKTYDTDLLFSMKPNFSELKEDYDMNNHLAVIMKKEKYYELPYARMGHFILASGRLKISNIIRTNLENIVRVHTDGVISVTPITNVKLGNDIGDLKFEEDGYCEVYNSCNYKFNGQKYGKKEEVQNMFL